MTFDDHSVSRRNYSIRATTGSRRRFSILHSITSEDLLRVELRSIQRPNPKPQLKKKKKIQTRLKRSALFASAIAAASAQASTDYGPAIWHPICSANYYTSGNGHKFHVVHDMEGYYASVVAWFDDCSMNSASIHYAVNGKKDASSDAAAGEITQLGVRESQYAWHAKCWNTHSTGTEHEGFSSNPAWYTDAMYQASGNLTAHLANKFGWAKDRNHVVGHNAKISSAWVSWASSHLGIDPTCNTHGDPGPYWDWSTYMAYVKGGGPNRLDVFARSPNNEIWHKNWNGSEWSDWDNMYGNATSDPAAVSWGQNRVDLFVRSTDNAVWSKNWNGTTWSSWYSIGGNIVGGPDVASWGANRLDVFGRGPSNDIWHKWWNGTSWSSWDSIGGNMTSDPSAVSWGANRIDVFARGTDGALWTSYWNGTQWSAWYSLGGTIVGGPDAASWGSGRLDVFVRWTDNTLRHIHYSSSEGSWSGWENLGGYIVSDPGAVSWGSNRIDIFARGPQNDVWSINWDGNDWSSFYSIGGDTVGSPDVASWSN